MINAKYYECMIAQIIEGNAYFGDMARFRSMSLPELKAERVSLKTDRKKIYMAFVLHRTVPWFALSMLLLFLVYCWTIFTGSHLPAMWVTIVALPLPFSLWWMTKERRPLMDAMEILGNDLKIVNAFIAYREVSTKGSVAKPGTMRLIN